MLGRSAARVREFIALIESMATETRELSLSKMTERVIERLSRTKSNEEFLATLTKEM